MCGQPIEAPVSGHFLVIGTESSSVDGRVFDRGAKQRLPRGTGKLDMGLPRRHRYADG